MWKKAKTPCIAKTLKHNNEECPRSGNLKPGLGDCILGGPWPWKRQPPGPQGAKQLEQATWQSLQKKGDRVSAKVSRKKTKPTGGRSTADGQKQQYAEHRYPCELTVWYTESIYKVLSQNRYFYIPWLSQDITSPQALHKELHRAAADRIAMLEIQANQGLAQYFQTGHALVRHFRTTR